MILPKEKLAGLNPNFQEILTKIAARLPFTLTLTSGLRTPGQNSILKGAVGDSSHLLGLAVDVATNADDFALYAIIKAALAEGVTRFGIYLDAAFKPIHLHFDVDPSKPQNTIFIKQELN